MTGRAPETRKAPTTPAQFHPHASREERARCDRGQCAIW
jgi:hypothetical protein